MKGHDNSDVQDQSFDNSISKKKDNKKKQSKED